MRLKLFIFLLLWGCLVLPGQRLVSLAPGITETVAALGLSGKLVGVTNYCDYPASVLTLPRIGGVLDLNPEAVFRLRPDIVLCYREHLVRLEPLSGKVKIRSFPHQKLDDLYGMIAELGTILKRERVGRGIVSGIRRQFAAINSRNLPQAKPRIALVVSREGDYFKNIIVAGRQDFLNEIVELCGATNCYRGSIAYPSIALENLLLLKPDLIIEFRNGQLSENEKRRLSQGWRRQADRFGLRELRVMIVNDGKWMRLGPRLPDVARELSALLKHE